MQLLACHALPCGLCCMSRGVMLPVAVRGRERGLPLIAAAVTLLQHERLALGAVYMVLFFVSLRTSKC